jgi:tetratricopeptide (TPR) repeat protein
MLNAVESIRSNRSTIHPYIRSSHSETNAPAPASSKAGQRRLRTETPATSYIETTETTTSSDRGMADRLTSDLVSAWQENRFEDAIRILDALQKIPFKDWGFPDEARPYFALIQAQLDDMKAFSLMMLNRPEEALNQHIAMMEKIKTYLSMWEDMNSFYMSWIRDRMAVQYALFLLENKKTDEAIAELQKAGQTEDPLLIFVLTAIQNKLHIKILQPIPPDSSETDWDADILFLAGRYEEALQKLDEGSSEGWCSCGDGFLRAACLAMLGRYDEALASCEKCASPDDLNVLMIRNLIRMMKGDLAGAKEKPQLTDADELMDYYFIAVPMILAIHWMENYSPTN